MNLHTGQGSQILFTNATYFYDKNIEMNFGVPKILYNLLYVESIIRLRTSKCNTNIWALQNVCFGDFGPLRELARMMNFILINRFYST